MVLIGDYLKMDKKEIRRLNLIKIIDEQFSGINSALARKINKDPSYVNRLLYEPGKKGKKGIGEDMAQEICDALSIEHGSLDKINYKNQPTTQKTHVSEQQNAYKMPDIGGLVPLISEVQAGAWCEGVDNYQPGDAEEWLACPVKHGKYTYALRVVGDSMTNPYQGKSYPEGTIIFVDPERQLINGCRVVAKQPTGDKVTFKEYREDSGKKYLKPLNPQYDMMEISDEARICGVVIFSGMAE